jgi:hypothetical protein
MTAFRRMIGGVERWVWQAKSHQCEFTGEHNLWLVCLSLIGFHGVVIIPDLDVRGDYTPEPVGMFHHIL